MLNFTMPYPTLSFQPCTLGKKYDLNQDGDRVLDAVAAMGYRANGNANSTPAAWSIPAAISPSAANPIRRR
jgi:hypothetical protein